MRRLVAASVLVLAARPALANGHGPVYGLATPTLGKGGFSLDVAAMAKLGDDGDRAMLRPMVGYGITPDLQLSVSIPVPLYTRLGVAPAPRMMAMMPAAPDDELLVAWRFARADNAVGSRIESTAIVGVDYPTDSVRGSIATSPGIVAGAVTGYASRSVYAWAGILYRRYMSPTGDDADHLGDAIFYSFVLGYRPAYFRHDYPAPDWRVFVEAVGERAFADVRAGAVVPDTGGDRVFVGPTVLGLFGAWGISGGPLFPVYQQLHGSQARETVRLAADVTYWF